MLKSRVFRFMKIRIRAQSTFTMFSFKQAMFIRSDTFHNRNSSKKQMNSRNVVISAQSARSKFKGGYRRTPIAVSTSKVCEAIDFFFLRHAQLYYQLSYLLRKIWYQSHMDGVNGTTLQSSVWSRDTVVIIRDNDVP